MNHVGEEQDPGDSRVSKEVVGCKRKETESVKLLKNIIDAIDSYLFAFSGGKPADRLRYFVEKLNQNAESEGMGNEGGMRGSLGPVEHRSLLLMRARMYLLSYISQAEEKRKVTRKSDRKYKGSGYDDLRDCALQGSGNTSYDADRSVAAESKSAAQFGAKRISLTLSDLKRQHAVLHIAELRIREDISYFEKVNLFLNTNFKLSPTDFWGHAIRGNFEDVMALCPEVRDAVKGFLEIRSVQKRLTSTAAPQQDIAVFCQTEEYKEQLKEWQMKYNVDKRLFTLFSGSYDGYLDVSERFCYGLAYGCPVKAEDRHLSMITGKKSDIIKRSKGWPKLVLMLSLCYPATQKQFEDLFEGIFAEIYEVDIHVAMRFLMYSGDHERIFNVYVTQDILDAETVDAFILKSSNSSGIHLVARRYVMKLTEEQDYECASRFIVKHSLKGVEYTPELVRYIVRHFERFKAHVTAEFLEDSRNKFVCSVHTAKNCDYETLTFLVSHEYAELVIEDIAEGVLRNNNADLNIIHKCLGRVIEAEKMTGNVYRETKLRLMEKIVGL